MPAAVVEVDSCVHGPAPDQPADQAQLARGPVMERYVRQLSEALNLDVPANGADPLLSLAPIARLFPWVVTRAGRELPGSGRFPRRVSRFR